MKAIARCSMPLLGCLALGSAVLAQRNDGPFYQCTPSVYEAAGVKLDCRGADKASENCESFDMPVADLRVSPAAPGLPGAGGTLVHVETTQTDGRAFVDMVSIARGTGAFTETETLDGVLVAKTVGVCVLNQPAATR